MSKPNPGLAFAVCTLMFAGAGFLGALGGVSTSGLEAAKVETALAVELGANEMLKEAVAEASKRADEQAALVTGLRGVVGKLGEDIAFLEARKGPRPRPRTVGELLAKQGTVHATGVERDVLNRLFEAVEKEQARSGGPVPVERLPTLLELREQVLDDMIRRRFDRIEKAIKRLDATLGEFLKPKPAPGEPGWQPEKEGF